MIFMDRRRLAGMLWRPPARAPAVHIVLRAHMNPARVHAGRRA
jgi:hypothetical protein